MLPDDIKNAREVLIDAFKKDPEFRFAYVANIAMLIYDDQRSGFEFKKGKFLSKAQDLTTIAGCNNVAEEIMRRLFY